MPRLGVHVSIAGGLPLAVDRASATGCEAFQIFTKSSNQWRARPLPAAEIDMFRRRVTDSGLGPVVAHNSYLINVASPDRALRGRSLAALAEELDRAETLGLYALVMHPGAFTSGTEAAGLRRVADGLDRILSSRPEGRALVLLETTAGQGTALGWRFEHLATILDRLGRPARVGVCLDTCHLFASGHDFRTADGYRRMMANLAVLVGLDRVHAIHLNDSKKPCGSRLDRHEHIGRGAIGSAAFRRLVADPRLARLPMLLETPKAQATPDRHRPADPWDRRNLSILRRMLRSPGSGRRG